MSSPNARPSLGLTICVGVIALVAGLAGGFVGGHLKGKAENVTAVNDARAAEESAVGQVAVAEKAKADLSAKLVDANGRLAETRKLLDERTGSLTTANREIEKLRAARATAGRPERDVKPKTYADELRAVIQIRDELIKEEPEHSKKVTSRISMEDAGLPAFVEQLRENVYLLESVDLIAGLRIAGYKHAIYTARLKKTLAEEKSMACFEKMWNAKWTTDEFADKLVFYQSQSSTTRSLLIDSILAGTRPPLRDVTNAIAIIAGDAYLDKLK